MEHARSAGAKATEGATQLLPPRLICFTDLEAAPIATTLERFEALARAARPNSILFVLRDKERPLEERLAFGRQLAPLVRAHGQRFGVADRLDLAAILGTGSVHLGEASLPSAEARGLLGAHAFVSRACHDPAAARALDADAVVLSPIFAERKGRAPLGLEILKHVAGEVGPGKALYALGGVSAANAQQCLAAGATGVAMIGEALRSADPAPLLAALGILRRAQEPMLDATMAQGASDPALERTLALSTGDAALAGTIASNPALAGTIASSPALDTEPTLAPPDEETAPHRFSPFGPYSEVISLATQGNMGWVARGYNRDFGRWELVKFLRPELAREPELVRQFMREGRVLAKLSHPHVVQVFAMYSMEGYPCLAMEFLEGSSLSALVDEAGGQLPVERALELLLEASRGLAAAHEVGLLHRDIKPDNLIVVAGAKGRVPALKLIDFGLATNDRTTRGAPERDPTLDSDAVGGTPLFLAPELWLGRAATPQTDLYALGVTFFYALTGGYPSGPLGMKGLMEYARSEAPPPSLRQARKDVPPALARLIERLISKDPGARPDSASRVVTELSGLREATRQRRLPETGPFRGLLPYGESERDVFFGREADVSQIIERLRTESALVLAGSAGSGKTSIALAGVAARVRDGALGVGFPFTVAALQPSRRPLAALEAALASALDCAPSELAEAVAAGPRDLLALVRSKLGGSLGLLLVIDQLETLLDEPEQAAEARRFADIVATFGEALVPELRVLTCLRAGALDRLVSFGGFQQLLSRGFVPVQPLGSEALNDAVERALAVAGYGLDSPEAFVEALKPTAGARYSGFLVGLGLASLWAERDDQARTLPVQRWVERGGFAGALTRHADATLESLSDADRLRAQELLSRLVSADGHAQRVERAELLRWANRDSALLELFLDHRLVIEIGDELELLSPSLLQTWAFLREAVADSGEDRVLRERVAAAARDWESQGRPSGALWHGEQGDRLVAWFLATEARLGPLELDFVSAVRNQERRRRILQRLGVAAMLTLFALVATWAVVGQRRLQRELAAERDQAQKSAERARRETHASKLRLAELELERDPSAALRAVHESLALGNDPKLDVLAWRARRQGVPFALPFQAGGAGGVRTSTDARRVAIWGSESLELLEIAGAGRARWQLPPTSDGKPAPPTALLALAESVVFGNARGELWQGSSTAPEPRRIGTCSGVVRKLALAPPQLLRVLCSDPGQTKFELLEGNLEKPGELRQLWAESATAAELSQDGARLVAAGAQGVTGWAQDVALLPKLENPAGDQVSALATLGPELVALGTEQGKLLLLAKTDSGWKVRAQDETPRKSIRRILASPNGSTLLSFGADGHALLSTQDLEHLAEIKESNQAAHFIEAYDAVAIGAGARLRVLSNLDGLLLADFAMPSSGITGLASADDWLFAASLDGATRAFSLTGLPRRVKRPSADPASRCSLAKDGSALACFSHDVLELRPLPGRAGRVKRIQLGEGQTARSERPLVAVAAGAVEVAWCCGSDRLCIWDGEQDIVRRNTGDVIWLAAGADAGSWLVAEAGPNGRALRALPTRGEPEPASTLSFVPTLLATARDGSRAAMLDSAGRLYAATSASGPYEPLRALGAQVSALAVLPGRQDFAFGTASGEVWLLKGDSLRALGRLPSRVVGLATDRDERTLLASTETGNVTLFDLETLESFRVFDAPAGITAAAFDGASGWFGFASAQGDAFRLSIDTTVAAFSQPPEDPLDPKTRPFEKWRGLGTRD